MPGLERGGSRAPGAWPLERVVVSQNEFWDLPLAYFNVFFNFGVGSFSSTFGFGRFLWGKMGFLNSYFAIKVKISKWSKLLSAFFLHVIHRILRPTVKRSAQSD